MDCVICFAMLVSFWITYEDRFIMQTKENDTNDPQIKLSVLWLERDRHFEHYKKIDDKLGAILDKLSLLPCETHEGDRKVLSTKLDGLRYQLIGMWCVVGVIFLAILGVGIKTILGVHL